MLWGGGDVHGCQPSGDRFGSHPSPQSLRQSGEEGAGVWDWHGNLRAKAQIGTPKLLEAHHRSYSGTRGQGVGTLDTQSPQSHRQLGMEPLVLCRVNPQEVTHGFSGECAGLLHGRDGLVHWHGTCQVYDFACIRTIPQEHELMLGGGEATENLAQFLLPNCGLGTRSKGKCMVNWV
jgi:hypothetical protein